MRAFHTLRVLLRYQMRGGVRVALRTLVPLAAAFTAAAVWMGSPWIVLAPVMVLLYPTGPSVAHATVAAAITIAFAVGLAPRTSRGMGGWVAHLPVAAHSRRRAATVGLAVALTPWLAIVAAAAFPVAYQQDLHSAIIRMLAIPLLALGSALAALLVGRVARGLAAAAAVSAWAGTWWLLLLSVLLLVVADRAAGELATSRGRSLRSSKRALARSLFPAARVWLRITMRAIGWRLLGCWLVAVAAVVPALFFITNNPLQEVHELLALRLTALLGAVMAMTAAAESLVQRRPPWPWVRSLPFAAASRVIFDAFVLGLTAAPAVLMIVGRGGALIPVMLVLPVLSLRAATAVRRSAGRQSGAAGDILPEGAVAAMAVALAPWLSLACVLLVPLALGWARSAEQRQDVSRWHELQHLAAGDPLSWSES